MKLSKLGFTTLAAALLLSISLQAKNEMKNAYLFGFASSFSDSTVYVTDIQEVDSAWFTSKNKFLISRENYSSQLRDYLSEQGEEHRTCVVEYAFSAKKAEKAWNKLYSRYAHNQKKKNKQKQTNELPPFQIKKLTKDQFSFVAVSPTEQYQEDEPEKPVKKIKAKKALKNQQRPQGAPEGPQNGQPHEGPQRP